MSTPPISDFPLNNSHLCLRQENEGVNTDSQKPKPGPINNIPPEILDILLTYAYDSSPQCSLVARSWEEGVINAKIFLKNKGEIGYQDLHPEKEKRLAFVKAHSERIIHFNVISNKPSRWNDTKIINIDDEEIKDIFSTCSNLRTITLEDVNFQDDKGALFQGISNLKNLSALNFMNCNNITENSLATIGPHQNLTSLRIKLGIKFKIQNLEVMDIKCITQFPNLTSFTFHGNYIDPCLTTITNSMTNLTRLELYEPRGSNAEEELSEINKLTNLTYLALWGFKNMTDGVVAKIVQKNLKILKLYPCYEITNKGITKITQLKNLILLYLDGCCNIGNQDLAMIAQFLPKLKVLKFTGSKITAEGLDQFNKITQNQFDNKFYKHSGTFNNLFFVKKTDLSDII